MPMTSARPVLVSPCVTLCVQLRADHGVLAERELSNCWRKCALFRTTRSTIVTPTSSSGKIEANAVVGDQRGQIAGLVVAELLPRRDHDAQHPVALLQAVGPASSPLSRFGRDRQALRGRS